MSSGQTCSVVGCLPTLHVITHNSKLNVCLPHVPAECPSSRFTPGRSLILVETRQWRSTFTPTKVGTDLELARCSRYDQCDAFLPNLNLIFFVFAFTFHRVVSCSCAERCIHWNLWSFGAQGQWQVSLPWQRFVNTLFLLKHGELVTCHNLYSFAAVCAIKNYCKGLHVYLTHLFLC